METDIKCLNESTVEKANIKPQVNGYLLQNGHCFIGWPRATPGCSRASPSFTMSDSFTNQVLEETELCTHPDKHPVEVSFLPKNLIKQWLKPSGQAE